MESEFEKKIEQKSEELVEAAMKYNELQMELNRKLKIISELTANNLAQTENGSKQATRIYQLDQQVAELK